ncbi:MAG: hypothetical protein WCF97_08640 [Nitrososphaeraceae archaeon]
MNRPSQAHAEIMAGAPTTGIQAVLEVLRMTSVKPHLFYYVFRL